MTDLPLVLIVDDSATVRSIVKVHLLGTGVRFREASTAEAAMDVCKSEPVALLILDHNLPGMSGIDFTRRLRAGDVLPSLAGVPVILLTGNHAEEVEREAVNAGVQAFVRKPVNQSGLSTAVTRLLGR